MEAHEHTGASRHAGQGQRFDRWVTNLRQAFTGESANVQRYTVFAQTAEIEGHSDVAGLFRDLATSTACAAQGHLDFLVEYGDPATGRPIGETTSSLAAAVVSEQREATELYPALASAAISDGLDDLGSWLTTLAALKKAHVEKLRQVLETSPMPPLDIHEPESA